MPRTAKVKERKDIRISMLLTESQKLWLEEQTKNNDFVNQSDIIRGLINQAMKKKRNRDNPLD